MHSHRFLLGISLLAACTFAGAAYAGTNATVVIQAGAPVYYQPPPPPPRYERVPPPRRAMVWEQGHWEWRHKSYVWVPGHWVRARHGHHYRQPGWHEVNGHWQYRSGGWDRDGDGVPNRDDRYPDNRHWR